MCVCACVCACACACACVRVRVCASRDECENAKVKVKKEGNVGRRAILALQAQRRARHLLFSEQSSHPVVNAIFAAVQLQQGFVFL